MASYFSDAPDAPQAIGPYSQAVVANGLAFLSGQVPLDPKTGTLVAGGIEPQTEQVMKNLSKVLAHLGLEFSHVVSTTIYLTDLGDFQKVNEIYARWMGEVKPARATVQVAALPKGAIVEISMIATRN